MKISNKERFYTFVNKTNECWVFTGCKDSSGYGIFYEDGKMKAAHRFSFENNIGVIPNGMCVLHKCDNRFCVNPDHLYAGNKKDNANDREDRNRGNHTKGSNHGLVLDPQKASRGEDHGMSKLKHKDVLFIRKNYKFRSKQHNSKALGERFGVDPSTILEVAHNNTWKE